MAEEPLFEVEYDDDGKPTHMRVGKHGIKLDQEDAQRIFDKYFDMRDTVDVMREENAKLKAQNKRFRKKYTALRKTREQEFAKSCEAATNSMGQIDTLRDKNAELRDENAKLRELVRDMWRDGMCDCDEFSRSIGVCVKCEYGYLERMRELGIEMG